MSDLSAPEAKAVAALDQFAPPPATTKQRRFVVFATPTLSSNFAMEWVRSIILTVSALKDYRVDHAFMQRAGDCFISKARNKLVTDFLRDYPDGTDLFFLDDDIGWPAQKIIEFLVRPEAIVAGIYPKRSDDLDFPVSLCSDLATGELIQRDGLYMASVVPTGFLRIKREVLEVMAAQSRMFVDIEADGTKQEFYNIFEDGVGADGWYWGEDYTFCKKWLSMGGELWVDPDVAFTHRGQKKWSDMLSAQLSVFVEKARAAHEARGKDDAADSKTSEAA